VSRFIIVLDSGSATQRNAITTFLQAKPWGFWHHLDDLLGQRVGDELAANPAAGAVEDAAEEAVRPRAQEAVAPIAEPGVASGFGKDEAGVVARADLRGGGGDDARAEFGRPAAGLAEEDARGGVAEIFVEGDAGDAFIEVGFDALVVAADDEGVGDFDGAGAVPALEIRHAGGGEAGNVGETDVADVVVGGELGSHGVNGWEFKVFRLRQGYGGQESWGGLWGGSA
jgi:hypothetical protein